MFFMCCVPESQILMTIFIILLFLETQEEKGRRNDSGQEKGNFIINRPHSSLVSLTLAISLSCVVSRPFKESLMDTGKVGCELQNSSLSRRAALTL